MRRPSVDTIITIDSLTTTTTDENETDITSFYSISLEIDTKHKENIPHLLQFIDDEQLTQETKKIEKRKNSYSKQMLLWFKTYLIKSGGMHETRPKRIAWHEYFWSFIGSFLGILIVAEMHYHLLVP